MKLKKIIRKIINNYGFEITRFTADSSLRAQYLRQLLHHKINIIFDIGANTGQFGQELRSLGYDGRIVSFEPLSECHQRLAQQASKDKKWLVAPRAAVGDRIGAVEINVSMNTVSSSLLNMRPTHENSAPTSKVIRKESAALITIDSISSSYLTSPEDHLFVKIDTQGYEDRVLRGMTEIFPRVKGIQMELSVVELYQDQLLMNEMIDLMGRQGFELWGMAPAFIDPINGKTMQFDATFFRATK